MPKKISHLYSRFFTIDLGSTNTSIYHLRRKRISRRPSLIALDRATKTIAAYGDKAREMLGRAPSRYSIIAPVRRGVVANFEGASKLLQGCLWQEFTIKRWPLVVAVNIPYGASQVEKQAVREAVRSSGAKDIHLVENPLAAMMGIELPYNPLKGSMVVDLGGGTTEIAVIALGGIVIGRSISKGGEELDKLLQLFFRKKYHINISPGTAESIKLQGGFLLNPPAETIKVAGIFLDSRLPGYLEVALADLKEVWQVHFLTLSQEIGKIFDQTPPELASDIIEQGIFLTGGGSLMRELGPFINQQTSLPVKIPEHPADCTVKGLAKILL